MYSLKAAANACISFALSKSEYQYSTVRVSVSCVDGYGGTMLTLLRRYLRTFQERSDSLSLFVSTESQTCLLSRGTLELAFHTKLSRCCRSAACPQ